MPRIAQLSDRSSDSTSGLYNSEVHLWKCSVDLNCLTYVVVKNRWILDTIYCIRKLIREISLNLKSWKQMFRICEHLDKEFHKVRKNQVQRPQRHLTEATVPCSWVWIAGWQWTWKAGWVFKEFLVLYVILPPRPGLLLSSQLAMGVTGWLHRGLLNLQLVLTVPFQINWSDGLSEHILSEKISSDLRTVIYETCFKIQPIWYKTTKICYFGFSWTFQYSFYSLISFSDLFSRALRLQNFSWILI